MLFDINLRSNIDRSNDDPIDNLQELTFKNNTMLWHKGGLHSIYKNEYDNGYLDAFERVLRLENNNLYIDNVYTATITNTIGKPTKGLYRYLNNDFVVEPGQYPIHNGPISMMITNNNMYGPVNTRAEFFFYNNILYEIEQGSTTNRQFNFNNNTWSNTEWNYCAINNSKLIFGKNELQNTLGDDSWLVWSINLINGQEQHLTRPATLRCYSVSMGPGYCLSFWYNGVGNCYCHWINVEGNCEQFMCNTILNNGNAYLPLDTAKTTSELVIQTDNYRNKVSTLSTNFSYTTGNFVIYRGVSAGLVNSDYIITGPLTPFSVLHTSSNSHLYSDGISYYRVQLNVAPTLQKMSEYVWQVNDGSIIMSDKDKTTYQPKIGINLSFISPYVERTITQGNASNSYLIAASNNANYENTNLRTIGGITPQFTMIFNGCTFDNLGFSGASSIGPWKGDYYFGLLSTGGARYKYSNNNGKYVNKSLTNLIFPSSSNPLYPLPSNVTIIRTKTPNVMFTWSDFITSIGIVNNNRTMLAYYLFSTFYGGETFFYLLRNYYMFDGENVYESADSPGNLTWNGNTAAIGEGLKYLSSDSHQAFFYSESDRWIYSFSGDYQIRPVLDMSNTTILDAVYSPALDLHAFLTPNEVIFLCKGQLSNIINENENKWVKLDTTLKGLVIYREDNTSATLSLFNGELVPSLLETSYINLKDGFTSQFTEVLVNFKQIDNYKKADIEIETNTLLTLDKLLTKSSKQTIVFDEGKNYKIVKIPVASNGRALSIKISSNNPIQINYVTIDAEINAKTPVKAQQGVI